MLPLFPIANLVLLLVVVVLLLRRRSPAAGAADPRLAQLLDADLPGAVARADARGEALERHLRDELGAVRAENAAAAGALRTEIIGNINTLGDTIRTGLDRFRGDNKAESEQLRTAVEAQLAALAQRLSAFSTDTLQRHNESREALHESLTTLRTAQAEHQEKLRGTVEARLDALNASNEKKLEDMRQTVDEKLNATLQTRFTESFGAVTDKLAQMNKGLGEMNTLTAGVNDLNRIFSNVKSRGGFAEVQLGNLLEQVLAPGQYVKNARVKKGSQEAVEFAVQFPGGDGETVLLPIDAKFPREDWERLETAYEGGSQDEIDAARKGFDGAIRTEGKRICSKYINEPVTTPYAIMFLPTEGLYSEVLRRDGLQSDLHQSCKVMVAGPSTLYALLTSFQLGFQMLNLQKKGNEVWEVLRETKTEFGRFGTLMDKMEKKMGEAQNVMHDLGVRTRSISRKLRDVSEDASQPKLGTPEVASAVFDGLLPMLAAEGEDGDG